MFTMQKIPNDLEFSKRKKIIFSLVIKHVQEKQFLHDYCSLSLSLSLSLSHTHTHSLSLPSFTNTEKNSRNCAVLRSTLYRKYLTKLFLTLLKAVDKVIIK